MIPQQKTALIIGAGPAGLMAAEVLAQAGFGVTIADQMPSPARKFLMAGKSGLNLTKAEELDPFCATFADVPPWFEAAIRGFGPVQVQAWARGLGQDVFTGSTGRVFPVAMKASPLLRAWLTRLAGLDVALNRRWQWTGWANDIAQFQTPQGPVDFAADVTVLALGGGSWRKLGSDGAWAAQFGADVAPFEGANLGIRRVWTPFMARHFGQPIKSIALVAGDLVSRGEVVITQHGIEGGGIYALTPALRGGGGLTIDFAPDLSIEQIRDRQLARRKGETLARFLKSALHLSPAKIALFQELVKSGQIADPVGVIKAVPFEFDGFAPMDQAISTAGGLRFEALDNWMLRARKGVFVAGEMLDWEAPTGGYLITGCLASGRAAAQAALDWTGTLEEIDT